MKSIKRKDISKVREALALAYHEKVKVEVDDKWKVRVMGHIQSLGPLSPHISYFELYQRFVWRLAPVACVLLVALSVAIAKMDFFSDYELAKIFTVDPADVILMAWYNG